MPGFIDSFVSMSDSFGKYLTAPLDVNQFVNFSDNAASVAVNVPSAPQEVAAATGQAISDAGSAIGNAVTGAASNAANTVLPYFIVGGVLLTAISLRNSRG